LNAKFKGFVLTRDRRIIKRIQKLVGRYLLVGDHRHDIDGAGVVLFMDVLRPFPYLGGLLNRMTITAIAASPFIRYVKTSHEAWERRMFPLWI
jgi:hypothetical protein